MREEGAAGPSLNEVARRVGMRPQSLDEYFPSKAARYDALCQLPIRLFGEGEERVRQDQPPGWDRIRAWFEVRIALARAHPDLYHLAFDAPVPGFVPSAESVAATRQLRAAARRALTEAIDAGAGAPGMATERVVDLLLALRHGLIAVRLGKEAVLPAGSDRFSGLVPDVIAVLRAAWAPVPPPAPGSTGGA